VVVFRIPTPSTSSMRCKFLFCHFTSYLPLLSEVLPSLSTGSFFFLERIRISLCRPRGTLRPSFSLLFSFFFEDRNFLSQLLGFRLVCGPFFCSGRYCLSPSDLLFDRCVSFPNSRLSALHFLSPRDGVRHRADCLPASVPRGTDLPKIGGLRS